MMISKLIKMLICILSLYISTAYAESTQKQTNNTHVNYMYVVAAGRGHIQHVSTNHYILSMQIPSVNQVIQFSDRPQRIVKYISGQDLTNSWSQGDNSFTQDPPNAVLSGYNLSPKIIVLTRERIQGDTISYHFTSEKALATKNYSQITLTIDYKCLNGGIVVWQPGCTS